MKILKLVIFATLVLGHAAHAGTIITYTANLLGTSEVPSNASPGIGFAIVTVDTLANTMNVNVTFSGLTGTTTAAHIHCCTAVPGTGNAGVATTTPSFADFPLGVTSGTDNETLDLTLASSYNPAFVLAGGKRGQRRSRLARGPGRRRNLPEHPHLGFSRRRNPRLSGGGDA